MRIAKLAPEHLDLSVLQHFDRAGADYIFYPTVDRFVEAFDAEAYRTWAKKRNVGAVLRPHLLTSPESGVCSTPCNSVLGPLRVDPIADADKGSAGAHSIDIALVLLCYK